LTASPEPCRKISIRGSRRGHIVLPVALALSLSLCTPTFAQQPAWLPADSSYVWSFPRDHWSHPGTKTEWWYLTGHLEADDDSTQQYGFQFTFFRIGLSPRRPRLDSAWNATDLILGHAAVTDLTGQRHLFSEVLHRAIPLLGQFNRYPDSLIAWVRAPAGAGGRWTLSWNGEAFDVAMVDSTRQLAFTLATRPLKPLVLEGPNGYSRKGRSPTAASQYYSFTRLGVSGTLTLDGRLRRVQGHAWFDQEFGSHQLEARQVGWDWFSLQLDDGRDLMLYQLRGPAGRRDWASGTLVQPDGAPSYLSGDDWRLSPEGSWKSPATGTVYPRRWRLEVPSAGLELEVVPLLMEQENRSRLADLHYWEGAVEVRSPGASGRRLGQGYVELTGRGEGNRPPL
jgi:predicted secreted hydrolase